MPDTEQRLAGAASGVALTTTAAFTQFPRNTAHVALFPRNFSTAVVARYIECPWLVVIKTLDALARRPGGKGEQSFEASEAVQDALTTTDLNLSEMEVAATGGFVYVGSHIPFRGVSIDVDGTNSAGSSVLTVRYSRGKGDWVAIGETDNTESTRSLAQDGTVVWTVPAGWQAISLREMGDTNQRHPLYDTPMYWTRWEWSVAFTDTSVTLDSMTGINRSTAYDEIASGEGKAGPVENGPNGISGYEALTDAGTANLLITVTANGRFR